MIVTGAKLILAGFVSRKKLIFDYLWLVVNCYPSFSPTHCNDAKKRGATVVVSSSFSYR